MNGKITAVNFVRSRESDMAKVDRIMEIWLETNIDAHHFVSKEYWLNNYEAVRDALFDAQILTYEQDRIEGFAGITDKSYIAGLFVAKQLQRHGVGSLLIEECKRRSQHLELGVYVKNTGSVAFYEKHGFTVKHEKENDATHEQEYHMSWTYPVGPGNRFADQDRKMS